MTTKELINQYVTAHADNRWMDASELEALLTEFAEKLQEPASEDLEEAAEECVDGEDYPYTDGEGMPLYTPDYLTYMFRQGAQWQKEQMIKDAIDATVTGVREYREENEVDFTIMLEKGIVPYVSEEDVKLIIIKE